jgi:hypothetical protein
MQLLLRRTQRHLRRRNWLWLHLPRESSRPPKPRVRGFTPGFPTRERATNRTGGGGDTEVTTFVLLSGSAPAVALSSQPGSGAGMSDELRGALVPDSGSGMFAAGCRLLPTMTRVECCSLLMTRRSMPRPNVLDVLFAVRRPCPRKWVPLPWYVSRLAPSFSL